MSATNDEDDLFKKYCLFAIGSVITFIFISFILMLLNSCTPSLQQMWEEDQADLKHIAADDLRDIANEIELKEIKETN